MKKKYYIILISVIILAILTFVIFPTGKFVSQGSENVKDITVTLYPNSTEHEIKTITITDTDTIKDIYELLDNTKANRHSLQNDNLQWDSEFIIDIYYNSGESDQITSTESTDVICRILNERTYITGESPELWNYLSGLNI